MQIAIQQISDWLGNPITVYRTELVEEDGTLKIEKIWCNHDGAEHNAEYAYSALECDKCRGYLFDGAETWEQTPIGGKR